MTKCRDMMSQRTQTQQVSSAVYVLRRKFHSEDLSLRPRTKSRKFRAKSKWQTSRLIGHNVTTLTTINEETFLLFLTSTSFKNPLNLKSIKMSKKQRKTHKKMAKKRNLWVSVWRRCDKTYFFGFVVIDKQVMSGFFYVRWRNGKRERKKRQANQRRSGKNL